MLLGRRRLFCSVAASPFPAVGGGVTSNVGLLHVCVLLRDERTDGRWAVLFSLDVLRGCWRFVSCWAAIFPFRISRVYIGPCFLSRVTSFGVTDFDAGIAFRVLSDDFRPFPFLLLLSVKYTASAAALVCRARFFFGFVFPCIKI